MVSGTSAGAGVAEAVIDDYNSINRKMFFLRIALQSFNRQCHRLFIHNRRGDKGIRTDFKSQFLQVLYFGVAAVRKRQFIHAFQNIKSHIMYAATSTVRRIVTSDRTGSQITRIFVRFALAITKCIFQPFKNIRWNERFTG